MSALKLLGLAALLSWAAPARAHGPALDWDRIAQQAGAAGLSRPDPPRSAAAPAVAGRPVLPLKGFVSLWAQDCGNGCGLPSPLLKNDPVELALGLPDAAGEFRSVRLERLYPVQGQSLKVRADFYALCPPAAKGAACAGRYFQVQVELSGAAAALCTVSLNEADAAPFPVLACAAPQGSRRIGVSLHRLPL